MFQKFDIKTWSEGDKAKGDYSFPFQLKIPDGCPPSLFWRDKKCNAEATISYTIEAILDPMGEDKSKTLSHTVWFSLHAPAKEVESSVQTGVVKLKKCGCLSKGSGKMSTKLDKTLIQTSETARILADIDNERSQLDCKSVILELVQDTTLSVDGAKYNMITKLGQTSVSGLVKGEKNGGLKKFCDFDLKNIKIKVNKKHIKQVTNAEKQYASLIQPSVKGFNVETNYLIHVKAKYPGGEAKTKHPIILLPGEAREEIPDPPKKWSPTGENVFQANCKLADPEDLEEFGSPSKSNRH